MPAPSTTILPLSDIQTYLKTVDLIPLIEEGFVAYSKGDSIVPPVGELLFDKPSGEAHIKYGYIKGQSYYAIKIASGFPANAELGIKTSQGVVLLFSQQTGVLRCVLLDEGLLTDVRTAIASMITLKHLAPKKIKRVGIVGTGVMAKLQLAYLHQVTDCKDIVIWGRTPKNTAAFQAQFLDSPFKIMIADSLAFLASECNVIITTTSATEPLIYFEYLQKGTHITALGSDTAHKIELDPNILQYADSVVVDSIPQSQSRGEVFQARKYDCLDENKLVELGNLIKDPSLGRQNEEQITVADLTGVAVQDIMIATAIFEHHLKE